MNEDTYAEWDGAYVLGALEPGELAEYEAHLAECPACRDAVEQLRPTVAVLSRARAAGFTEHPEPMPDTLLPGLLRKATQERNRRRGLVAALGGLAAACVIALAVVLWPGSDSSSAPTPQAMRVLRPDVPVTATAALVSKAWGTEIDLQCRYTERVNEKFPYKLRVIDKNNNFHEGGSWSLVPNRQIAFTGGTDVPLSDVKTVQITLLDGTPILQLDA
jgi:Putative zinc-finger